MLLHIRHSIDDARGAHLPPQASSRRRFPSGDRRHSAVRRRSPGTTPEQPHHRHPEQAQDRPHAFHQHPLAQRRGEQRRSSTEALPKLRTAPYAKTVRGRSREIWSTRSEPRSLCIVHAAQRTDPLNENWCLRLRKGAKNALEQRERTRITSCHPAWSATGP